MAEKSTVLLKNDEKVLPITGEKKNLHFLVIGNASAFTVASGGGSGHVFETPDIILPPLWAICDELGVERIPLLANAQYRCNKTNGNCVTYLGSVCTVPGAERVPNPYKPGQWLFEGFK